MFVKLWPKIFFTLVIFLFGFANSAIALSELSTDFDSIYDVGSDGVTQVTHRIKLTNQISHLYPTQYSLQIGGGTITDIRTTQDGLPTNYTRDDLENGTLLTLNQLNPVVGIDRSTTLEIKYNSPDLAEVLGRTWSINIPRLARANEANSFTRTILIPSELQTPTATFPDPTIISTASSSGKTKLVWRGFPTDSLTLLFGHSQYYLVNLTYHLDNPTLGKGNTEIALPPDTAYQRVILQSLDPPPHQIRVDTDGNWLAQYPLKTGENQTVKAELYLEVFPLPRYSSPQPPLALTSPAKYWESDSPDIKELASRLKTPVNIYQYLLDHLIYNYQNSRKGSLRLGAAASLANPKQALCTEFTDSFIALARARKIPAREINGYAYSQNPALRPRSLARDVLHAWPEYYDSTQNTWIQIDPTWSYTTGGLDYFHKLDFNHLAFVIHGKEPDYPLPAGAYKSSPEETTISVTPVETLPEINNSLSRREEDGKTILTNTGNVAVTDSEGGYLPPYAQVTLSLPHSSPSFFPPFFFWGFITIIGLGTTLRFRRFWQQHHP